MDRIHLFSIIFLIAVVLYVIRRVFLTQEAFQSEGWDLVPPAAAHYEQAHGIAPAGIYAVPGHIQQHQNRDAPTVNPDYKYGNPQNTNPEYKEQPLLEQF